MPFCSQIIKKVDTIIYSYWHTHYDNYHSDEVENKQVSALTYRT